MEINREMPPTVAKSEVEVEPLAKPMVKANRLSAVVPWEWIRTHGAELKRIERAREDAWKKKQAALRDAKKKKAPPRPPYSAGMVWRKKSPPPTKYLFMFFSYPSGTTSHQLCAAKVFPESSTSNNNMPQPVEKVLSFPSKDFPVQMCCVQLDSKLYFIGGNRVHNLALGIEDFNDHPRDVYILDPSIVHKPGSDRSIHMLKKGRPMNTGKPKPYAVVANRKIYVISPVEIQSNFTRERVSRFEVFQPERNVWVTLPEPPDLGRVTGHAVVGGKILFSLFSDEVFYYDVRSRRWGSLYSGLPRFFGVAHYVDFTFYACCQHRLTAFTSLTGRLSEGLLYFDCSADAEPQQDYYSFRNVIDQADNLIHLGDQTFCCLKLYDKLDGDNRKDFAVKIAVFQANLGIDRDFQADISSVSELALQINSGGVDPELMAFSDVISMVVSEGAPILEES